MHSGTDVKAAASSSVLSKGVPMLARGGWNRRMGFLWCLVLFELVVDILCTLAGHCRSARKAEHVSIVISRLWLHACLCVTVVDYDAMRDAASEAATKQATVVRMLVSKLGRAQRAAEATLDLCVT